MPFALTPRASLAVGVADADPAAPGLQVFEGMTVPSTVNVVAGISVQQVGLLVDGELAATDTAAPFQFSTIAPVIGPDVTSFTVQALVTDAGGSTTLTDLLTIELLEDVTPPTIASVNPPTGSTRFEGLRTIDLAFSEPLDLSGAGLGSFLLFEAGPSGMFDDGDDVPVAITSAQLINDATLLELSVEPLPIGVYELRVNESGLADRAGNLLGAGTFATGFTLTERTGPFLKTNAITGVVDSSSTTRIVTFVAEDFGRGPTIVTDVNVIIDFMKHDGESFGVDAGGCAFNNEIFFRLRSPAGTLVTFVPTSTYANTCPRGGRVIVSYDDDALALANNIPTAGSFRPPVSLAAFDGQEGVGVWTITIGDSVGADALSFWSVSVELNTPEETALSLAGEFGLGESDDSMVGAVAAIFSLDHGSPLVHQEINAEEPWLFEELSSGQLSTAEVKRICLGNLHNDDSEEPTTDDAEVAAIDACFAELIPPHSST